MVHWGTLRSTNHINELNIFRRFPEPVIFYYLAQNVEYKLIDSKMLVSWLVEALFTVIWLAVQSKHLDQGIPSQEGYHTGVLKFVLGLSY